MKPCDCQDEFTASKLNEQGIQFNDNSIVVQPNSVILTMGHTTIKIPMKTFEMFAKWYLEDQEIKENINPTILMKDYNRNKITKLTLKNTKSF